ncbi:Toll/interleukin-1 receptor homology (TIR) domain [Arabidopsis thaliana x Arabidopsis arenosa]|uniref:Toll/interleukin-1 receptor homology (TIR) domain n=1 Tax=Arabidopsis thaliana x Arabidopsis arenosa TaxID=1240361 RepID=A0A8T1YDF5_9BRAS|nr:Toll/interleukin-1 receptor homology (TIR) domain [Arabidopsis thaliana x Arabidopsis arenosa]
MSIVAFSENFANSSWCLDELVEIMECNKEMGKIVIPIFYGVEPSHVKKQTESFGETFNKTCKGIPEEKILQWREALSEAATTAGVDSRDWPDEAKMIEEIASDVSNKLNSKSSNDFDDCVGIKSHMIKMELLLEWKSEEVIMVGIWGPSGVGKTTIGRALFSRLSMDGNKKFQGSIFIDKTKDIYRSANSGDYNMKLHLQRQFLSEILDEKDIKIYSLSAVKERLGHKKVLVVFDDVDDQVLLQALVGHTSWFGSGSRIVVISKDRELLRARGIESHRIYQVALPSQELAFQMFCQCAFGQDSPDDGFMELAIDAANLTGNLPLALNVLGSSLAGMKKEEWADRLPKLRDGMAGTVDKTLKDSYDRLKEEEKEIFRHIACLFNHKTRDYVIRLLEDRLDVRAGLTTLAERCLINISADKIIRMHDFLQKMGRDIVRPPCTREPGKCQFLMDSKDIYDVLVAGTGTNGVLGIFLNLSEIEDGLHIREKAFRKMQNLRFLSMYGVLQKDKEVMLHLQGGKYGMWFLPQKEEDQMWRQLRLLEWWGCSMRCMPSNFYAKNLVELRMPDSHLEKLWEGAQVSFSGLNAL